MRLALFAVLALGCSSRSEPAAQGVRDPATPATPATPAGPPPDAEAHIIAQETSMPAADDKPLALTISEGTPVKLPDGVTVDARGIIYAHLANSKNMSAATLVVVRGAERVEVPLDRRDVNEDVWRPALGWEFKLDYADPYQRPSRAAIFVRRAK